MTPQLTVAVLTYNGEQLLPECLTSIFQQEFPVPTELLILDNGSEEPVSWPLPCVPVSYPKNLERVRIERVEPNCGNIGGQNRCFEQARGEWVLFVANDVRLKEKAIDNLWKNTRYVGKLINLTNYGCFDLLCPTLLQLDGKIDNQGLLWLWPGYGMAKRTGDWFHPTAFTGSCYLMPKKTWELVGMFDELLFASHEDIDFCIRAKSLNHFAFHVNEATAIHLGHATLKHTLSNPRAAFHRERRMVIRKHYHGLDQWTRLGAEWVIYHLCFLFGMKQ